MNKTAIKNFSIWARNRLIDGIKYRARLLGITEDGIQEPSPEPTEDTELYDIGTAAPYSVHDGKFPGPSVDREAWSLPL